MTIISKHHTVDTEKLFESEFSWFFIGLTFLGFFFGVSFIVMLSNFEFRTVESPIHEVLILIFTQVVFFGFILLILNEILRIKKLVITKDYLIFKYVFLGYSFRVAWEDIDQIDIRFSPITDNSNFNKKDRKYIFRMRGNKIILYSQLYKNFMAFTVELDKRLPSRIKQEMKFSYKQHGKAIQAEERRYEKQLKYFIGFLILVLIIALIVS